MISDEELEMRAIPLKIHIRVDYVFAFPNAHQILRPLGERLFQVHRLFCARFFAGLKCSLGRRHVFKLLN